MDASASTASGSESDAEAGPWVSSPAIWLSESSSIDPTALPLRDNAYSTTPQAGLVYVCDPLEFQQVNGPGAKMQGDWLNLANSTYDVTKKVFVQGNVYFDNAELSITTTDTERQFAGNGLPFGVPTGIFPVQTSDPASAYDPNPNASTVQNISFSIPRNPTINAQASCAYKQIGITVDGVQLHLPFDSQGRDELAYQLQDVCTGAPQPGGAYHRHALSECLPHIHDNVALVGYALDGFGIFSPFDENGTELASADLDECHGITSEIEWEGQTVSMYHYVMTRDFPTLWPAFAARPRAMRSRRFRARPLSTESRPRGRAAAMTQASVPARFTRSFCTRQDASSATTPTIRASKSAPRDGSRNDGGAQSLKGARPAGIPARSTSGASDQTVPQGPRLSQTHRYVTTCRPSCWPPMDDQGSPGSARTDRPLCP